MKSSLKDLKSMPNFQVKTTWSKVKVSSERFYMYCIMNHEEKDKSCTHYCSKDISQVIAFEKKVILQGQGHLVKSKGL